MIFKKSKTGYIIDWERISVSNVSKMIYDGVDFLEVYIEYFDYAWAVKITVKVVPENKLGVVPPVVMSEEFSKEFLEFFDINILDYNAAAADPERLLINLIKITSDAQRWSKKMNTFLNSKLGNKPNTGYGNPSNIYFKENTYGHLYAENTNPSDAVKIKNLSKELEEKNQHISQLEEELKDLKEEIEMLKAVNQEC
jgi:hypothetical protein